MSRKNEIHVVTRNSFSRLRLVQFLSGVILVIGIIGFFNGSNTVFAILFILGLIGIIVTRFLRWMHRD